MFGQGLNRAHPHMQDLIASISKGDDKKGFSKHVRSLLGHGTTNAFRAFSQAITRTRSKSDISRFHESQLNRLSAAFAVTTDLGLILGGRLKTAEQLSGRYADILSNLYLGYSVLWFAKKNNVQQTNTIIDHALTQITHDIEDAFYGIFDNFPVRPIGFLMRGISFPLGRAYSVPSDGLVRATSQLITTESEIRKLLSESVFISENPLDRVSQINEAFSKCIEGDKILSKLRKEKRDATVEEQAKLDVAEKFREDIIQVDAFEQLVHPHEHLVSSTTPGISSEPIRRSESFDVNLVEDTLVHAIKSSGSSDHNDPHAPRGKETSSALGW